LWGVGYAVAQHAHQGSGEGCVGLAWRGQGEGVLRGGREDVRSLGLGQFHHARRRRLQPRGTGTETAVQDNGAPLGAAGRQPHAYPVVGKRRRVHGPLVAVGQSQVQAALAIEQAVPGVVQEQSVRRRFRSAEDRLIHLAYRSGIQQLRAV
jgi:hypothetical protein